MAQWVLNSIRIVMEKSDDVKILYLFKDGKVRDMSNGFGDVYNYSELYEKLIEEGYKQVYNR